MLHAGVCEQNKHVEERVIQKIVKANIDKHVIFKEKRRYKRISDEDAKAWRESRAKGFTYAEIAKRFDISARDAFKYTKDVKCERVRPVSNARSAAGLTIYEREVLRMASVVGRAPTFLKVYGDFIRTLSRESARLYAPVIAHFTYWCKKNTSIDDEFKFINEDNVEKWLQTKRMLAPKTRLRYVASVRKFVKYLRRHKFIEHDLVIFYGNEVIDDGVVKTQPMTEAEFTGILAAARKKWEISKWQTDRPIATQIAHRNYIVLLLLASLGARAGAVVELRKEDWDGVAVSLRQKRRNTRLAFRIPDDVAQEVNHYVETHFSGWHESSWLFPVSMKRTSNISVSDANTIVKNIAKEAGVKRRVTTHMFRVTFALICHRNGMNMHELKNRLSHLDLRMTAAYLRRIDLSKDNKYMPSIVSISKGINVGPVITGA